MVLLVGLLNENAITGGPLRIVSYRGEQYVWCFIVGLASYLTIFCRITSYMHEKSGLITLLAFIGIVYGFMGDIFLFNESFQTLELVASAVILVVNIMLIATML